MGNIESRRIKSFFPSSQNLDNPSTKSEENHQHSNQSFATSYDPKKQSLLQLTLTDNAEIQLILSNISLYTQQSKTALNQGYSSISSLKEYYKVKKDGYCTKQYIFYLIFQGCSCCGFKDQFSLRKMINKKFTDQQILSILKTYLDGIFIYIKKFKRNIEKIDLDDIGFEMLNSIHDQHFLNQNQQNIVANQRQGKRRIRIFFTEPWLKQKRQQEIMTVNEVNILLQNPSPERLKYNSTNIVEEFDQFEEKTTHNYGNDSQKSLLSLLFSIGVIGLKLLQMGFVDDIYIRAPHKRVNFERIKDYLEKHQTSNHHNNPNRNFSNSMNYDSSVSRKKLISGLRILLLSNSPEERERIYEFWSVKLDDTNYLDEINLQYSGHFQTEREETQNLQIHNQNVPVAGNSNFPVRNRGRSKTSSVFGKLYDLENASFNLDQAQTNHQFPQKSIIAQNDPFQNRNYVYKQQQMKPPKFSNTQINFGNPNNPIPIQNQQQMYQQNYQPNNQNQQLPFQNALIQNSLFPQRKATTVVKNSDVVFGQQQQRLHNNNQHSYLSNSINLKGQITNPNYQSFPNGGQNKAMMQQISQKPTHQQAFLYTGV